MKDVLKLLLFKEVTKKTEKNCHIRIYNFIFGIIGWVALLQFIIITSLSIYAHIFLK